MDHCAKSLQYINSDSVHQKRDLNPIQNVFAMRYLLVVFISNHMEIMSIIVLMTVVYHNIFYLKQFSHITPQNLYHPIHAWTPVPLGPGAIMKVH